MAPGEQGLHFAMQTKGVLGKALMNAINMKGTENALAFCSTRAIYLTDSMAVTLNASIKRVSDKNRNPLNSANNEELAYIEKSKTLLYKGEKINPQIVETNSEMVGYYPIMMENMCLQCHGITESEVLPNTLQKINSIYPNDKAIGYKSGELRGIWVVKIKK
jgi:nitrate reductase cytochrome c-type subunit